MRRQITIVMAACAAVLCAPASGQTATGDAPQKMTLGECLSLGLDRNYDLRIVRDRERIAANNATAGNAGFLPTVDLSSGYSGTLNDIDQEARAGGTTTSKGVNNNTLSAGVNLNWTVFDGFNVQTTYKRLKELHSMGELGTRLALEDYITTLVSEYYNYIRQQIRLKNMQYAIELSQERVRIVETSYQIGVLSRLDLQQARLDLNADRSQLIKQHEVLHSLRTRLNEIMGAEIDFPLVPADSVITYSSALELPGITQSMLEDNIYLLIAQKEKDVAGLDLKLAQSRNYPYLRVNGGYGYTQNWYETGTNREQRTVGLNFGATLGINLFDGLNKRRQVRNARIEGDISALSYEKTEQGLRKDLSDAWMAYSNNMKLTQMERGNLDIARENYEIAMERYKEFQLSGIELREAQNTLLSAEERLVQAEFDTKMCEVTLLQIAGRIVRYLE